VTGNALTSAAINTTLEPTATILLIFPLMTTSSVQVGLPDIDIQSISVDGGEIANIYADDMRAPIIGLDLMMAAPEGRGGVWSPCWAGKPLDE